MAWFYNSHSGQVIEDSNPITEPIDVLRTKTGTGWHEYGNQAQMLAAITANHWPAPQYGNSIADNLGNAPKIATGTGAAAISHATGIDVSKVNGFFGSLSSASTWLRVAKVVAGGALLLIGLAHLTGTDKALEGAATSALPAGKAVSLAHKAIRAGG